MIVDIRLSMYVLITSIVRFQIIPKLKKSFRLKDLDLEVTQGNNIYKYVEILENFLFIFNLNTMHVCSYYFFYLQDVEKH